MTYPLLQALSARILFVRIKVNTDELRMINDAAVRKYGDDYNRSNIIREALNLLLDIDLPMVRQGAPVGNKHHADKRGANQYTMKADEPDEMPRNTQFCAWCGRK